MHVRCKAHQQVDAALQPGSKRLSKTAAQHLNAPALQHGAVSLAIALHTGTERTHPVCGSSLPCSLCSSRVQVCGPADGAASAAAQHALNRGDHVAAAAAHLQHTALRLCAQRLLKSMQQPASYSPGGQRARCPVLHSDQQGVHQGKGVLQVDGEHCCRC